jgi:hypothetical protein
MQEMREAKTIREQLWNVSVDAKSYEGACEKYQAAILEQYKIYVEMADRVSNRRGLTNTFFLTLNTVVATIIGTLWKGNSTVSPWLLSLPLLIAVGQCVAWWWLVRSYRQLNGAKYEVIGALEERLPTSVWRAEWIALGEGGDWRKYLPLTHLEQWVPVLFGLVYLSALVMTIVLSRAV